MGEQAVILVRLLGTPISQIKAHSAAEAARARRKVRFAHTTVAGHSAHAQRAGIRKKGRRSSLQCPADAFDALIRDMPQFALPNADHGPAAAT